MNAIINALKPRIEEALARKEHLLVAIDGSCTAGKTTLAGDLERIFDCNVIHMDDFFLRPEQRTPERYAETGGNVDYERFREEVILPLKRGEPFSYRPFNCKTMTLAEPVDVMPKPLTIIEGSYSLHPYFRDPYDLTVFLSVTPELQRRRVLERPSALRQQFFEKWIPMEDQYFEKMQIRQKCDIVF